MVIVCQKCETRFQLDESRIPVRGARVRCSRCKHAFVVTPPGTHDETVHRLAEEAARSGRPSVPEPSVDLPGPGRRSARREEPEDDEWEFNIDPPAAPAGAAARPAARAPRAARAPAPAPEPAFEAPAPAPAASSPADADDGIESLFELGGLRDGEPAVLEGEITDSDPTPFDDGDLRPPRPAAPPAAAANAGDGWGLSLDDGAEAAAPEPASGARVPAGRRAAKASTRRAAAARAAPASSAEAPAATGAKPAARPTRERGVRLSGAEPGIAARVLGVAAFAPVAALFAFGLLGPLRPAPVERELASQPAGRLELVELHVRRLDNYWTGPVLIVEGALRNPGADAVALGGAPQLRLTGTPGADVTPGWLGAALHESALRERDPRELAAALETSARQLAARPLRPGEEVAVQAVFESPPAVASGLRVELAPVAAPPPASAAPGPEPEPGAESAPPDEAPPPAASDAGPAGDAPPGSAPDAAPGSAPAD